MVKLTAKNDKITKKLEGMLTKSRSMQSFLTRVIYPMYQNMQMQRWQTEGGSEGMKWQPLSSLYAARKLIIYGGGPKYKWVGGHGEGMPWASAGSWPTYPGSGTKMLIGKGRLASAVIGAKARDAGITGGERFHRFKATNNSITISIDAGQRPTKKDPGSEYFKYANEKREFMKFSNSSIRKMKEEIRDYIKAIK